MATLREIRRRISGVKSTQKITKAMKMVAAAKLRRAQERIVATRPYARKLGELLRHLVTKVDQALNPLLTSREVKRIVIVVVTADRGLCGAFNGNIMKAATSHIKTNYADFLEGGKLKLLTVGKKGFDFFNRRDYEIYAKHVGIYHALDFNNAREIVQELTDGYLKGEFDRVEVIYNEFKSVIQQRIVIEQLLPIPPEETKPHEPHKPEAQVEYIYEPSSLEIINALVPRHLNFQMWRVLLESNAAEQGARMSAMDNATENAKEIIRNLTLKFNNARQASITKELLEIVSGAEALRKAG
ncbi:MAG TPA: ATP synthase F1 subunit gamma [Bacteroidetes bacterium]|nr:ATP synthase F1 subunit gamma [Bacteroidota bacterium]